MVTYCGDTDFFCSFSSYPSTYPHVTTLDKIKLARNGYPKVELTFKPLPFCVLRWHLPPYGLSSQPIRSLGFGGRRAVSLNLKFQARCAVGILPELLTGSWKGFVGWEAADFEGLISPLTCNTFMCVTVLLLSFVLSLFQTHSFLFVSLQTCFCEINCPRKRNAHIHTLFLSCFWFTFFVFFNLLFLHYLIQHPYRVYLECTVTARKSNICLFDPSLQTTPLYCTFILPQPCILTHHVVRFPPPPANHKIFQKSSKLLFLFSFLCHLYCLGGGKKLFWVRSLWKQ